MHIAYLEKVTLMLWCKLIKWPNDCFALLMTK